MNKIRKSASPLAMVACVLLLHGASKAQETPKPPTEAEWQAVVSKGHAYLKNTQAEDGSWSSKTSIGITGIVTTGLLQTGASPSDSPASGGLKFIESLINEKTGHLAGADPRIGLQNYVTSVNLLALTTAKQDDKYGKVISSAATFLKKLQWDDGESKKPEDDFFGGAGYDSKSRPDLSNTQFFIDALRSAGVPEDDDAMKKVQVFVSRCQNFKSEYNTMPWADKINDGSFIYSAAEGGSTKTSDTPGGPLTGYGSMTYAGIKSLIYAGVGKDDPRVKTAISWIKKNYTVAANPGMPEQLKERGLYYYYHTMGKTLDLLGEDEFTDDAGKKHNWRADLFQALKNRQKPDGSWSNDNDRWMEGNPDLVTGYALMALSHCKPASK
jgi:squalene-hopene/tetraprenyl-beta-curcumene cyclase